MKKSRPYSCQRQCRKREGVFFTFMKKWEFSMIAGFILAVVLSSFSSFASACKTVRADTLRLHVLANSDSEEDQALKLYVRDCILKETGELFTTVGGKAQAEQTVDENLLEIADVAQTAVREKGYDYPVSVYRTNLYFKTTRYGNVTMPAGRYDALRVEIGSAKGHNWWCVLYPPLCLPAAEGQSGDVFSQGDQEVVESGYEVRFAVVELLEGAKEKWQAQKAKTA